MKQSNMEHRNQYALITGGVKTKTVVKKKQEITDAELNASWEGVDKAPGEEEGIKEKVTMTDLKGKTVDGDPEKESDQPVEQTPDDE